MLKSSINVVRKLCTPPSPPPVASPTAAIDHPLYISDGINCGGVPPQKEQLQLVSSSFLPPLRASLPLPESEGSFGGLWFWESYRRMLWGCDVLVNLSGTGVSLSEDTIETQKQLRLRAVKNCRRLREASEADTQDTAQHIVRHASAKLELFFATALSVALHVAQQPILEKAQGPQALFLCATKDQCDELTHILNYFCSELHLVVHNLFDLYPSIPSDKRAEIVVGTPPLWDNVIPPSTATTNATRRVGLEDLLSVVYGGPPPTYVTTRWRPYTAQFISQLVLCDVEQQTGMGYEPLLTRWLRNEGDGALPRDHQLYILMGGGHALYPQEQKARGALLQELEMRFQRSRGRGHTVVEMGFYPTLSTRPPLPAGLKRARDADADCKDNDTQESKTATCAFDSAHLNCGVLVRRALSLPRLLLDATAFMDLRDGIVAEVRAFWSHYRVDVPLERAGNGTATAEVLHVEEIVQFHLAFICTTERAATNEGGTFFQGACMLVLPSNHKREEKLESRYTLLFKHLEDKLNGVLFDGSIMSFVNLEDLQLNVIYQTISSSTIRNFNSVCTETALCQSASLPSFSFVYLRAVEAAAATTTTTISTTAAKREKELADLHAARQKICKLFEKEEGTHRDVKNSDTIGQIPIGTFLSGWDAYAHPFSVMVLRGFALPPDSLCGCSQLGQKPLALFYLEECTQYGRLVSYYCYGKKHGDGASETSLFLEFSSHEAAAEAVRMFRFRQDNGPITAKLFRVGVYYSGVEVEEEKRLGNDDSDDSELSFDFSLLAE